MPAPLIDLRGIGADKVCRLGDSPLGWALRGSLLDMNAPGNRERPEWDSFV